MTALFPTTPFDNCAGFASEYFATLTAAVQASDLSVLDKIAALVKETISNGNFIYICGNGGSAGIANPLAVRFPEMRAHRH